MRAGLAVIDAVGRLATRGTDLHVRLGVASGLVVVGDLIGDGCRAGARGRRRDPEPRRPAAGFGRAEHAGHWRSDAPADRRTVRARGSRAASARRLRRAATRLAGHRRKRRVEPLRGLALGGDAARRARRGTRAAAAPLATGEERRRAGGADLGRAGHRQVAAHRGAVASTSRASRTRGCAISARRIIRTARSTRSSPSSNAPPGSRATTRSKRSSANCRHCSRPGRADDDEIELLAELLSLPSSAADLNLSPQRKREMLFEALLHQLEAVARSRPVLDGFRGRALDRPDLARIARPDCSIG